MINKTPIKGLDPDVSVSQGHLGAHANASQVFLQGDIDVIVSELLVRMNDVKEEDDKKECIV